MTTIQEIIARWDSGEGKPYKGYALNAEGDTIHNAVRRYVPLQGLEASGRRAA